MDDAVRLLLVDDQQLVRAGFAMIFGADPRLEVVGEAVDGVTAIEQAQALHPDVVLMDIEMPRMNGIAATREIVTSTDSAVLMLTTFSDDENVLACLQAGASGFLLKNSEPEQLAGAVLAVARGQAALAPEVTTPVISRLTSPDPTTGQRPVSPTNLAALELLTEREREVLRHVGRGESNDEIAGELFIGSATVKTHVSACLSKLQLRDRVQLVVFAFESGFMDQPLD